MSVLRQANVPQLMRSDLVKHAVDLLSQQIWCWGRDILRPEGNWLLELGFDRVKPPDDREGYSSVYSLQLPKDRCVILRGFGVFYGDVRDGGIFMPRYEFRPKYTTHGTLQSPPWADTDLPKLDLPQESQQRSYLTLTCNLIDWLHEYEVEVVELLGIEYRRSILRQWDNGNRTLIPAEAMANSWKLLGGALAADCRLLLPDCLVRKDRSLR